MIGVTESYDGNRSINVELDLFVSSAKKGYTRHDPIMQLKIVFFYKYLLYK